MHAVLCFGGLYFRMYRRLDGGAWIAKRRSESPLDRTDGKVDSKGLSKPLTSPSRPWPRLPAELGSRQTPPPQTLSRLSALASPTPQRKMDRMSPARERAQDSKKGLHSPCTQQPRRQRSPAYAATYHAKPPPQQHCPPEPQQAQRHTAARALAHMPARSRVGLILSILHHGVGLAEPTPPRHLNSFNIIRRYRRHDITLQL